MKTDFFELDTPRGRLRCALRLSMRAKNLHLRILPDRTLEAVLPLGVSPRQARDFALAQKGWILRTLRRLAAEEHSARTAKYSAENEKLFPQSVLLPCLGGEFPVRCEWLPVPWTAAKCDPEKKEILLSGNVLDPEAVHSALLFMLKRSTEKLIFPQLKGLAAKFGFHPGNLSVRFQKSRWGSCSRRHGNISLNALLVLLPKDTVEYILIHELCHLKEMNHSEAFWREVSKCCPDFATRRKKLLFSGRELPSYFLQK